MTSCEPTRCSAYSEDLRWRIVWQTEALRYTSDQVAKELTRMRVALHYCLVQELCTVDFQWQGIKPGMESGMESGIRNRYHTELVH